MAEYLTSLPLVYTMARKVMEVGRTADMSRRMTGTPDEIVSYQENVRGALYGMGDAVIAVGDLLANYPADGAISGETASRLGWLLVTLGEMTDLLNGEMFMLEERERHHG